MSLRNSLPSLRNHSSSARKPKPKPSVVPRSQEGSVLHDPEQIAREIKTEDWALFLRVLEESVLVDDPAKRTMSGALGAFQG